MTPSIQTRCPHCFSCFNLPVEQLDQAEAKGRCGQCQQIFMVNDHLVVSAEKEQALAEHEVASSNINSQNNTDSSDDEYISEYSAYNFETGAYKVASYNESTNPNNVNIDIKKATSNDAIDTEHSAAENDVWQSLLDQSLASDIDNFDDQSFKEVSKPSDSSSRPAIASEPEHTTVDTAPLPTAVTAPAKEVSAVDNSINDHTFSTNDIIDDNAFIKGNRPPIQTSSNTNLTDLLTGKNTMSNNQRVTQEPVIKTQSRIQSVSTNLQTPVASLLWLAGCLVLVLLLFAQYVIFNLNTLIKNPAYAARLQTVCAVVVCSLPNADLSELSISELSYRSSQVNKSNNFSDIKANLVNNDIQPQLLPSLRVSVYDKDGLLGSFIAVPEEYLLSNQNQLAGNARESVMFTVPVAMQQIQQVTIDAIY